MKWRTKGRGSAARHFPIRGSVGRSRLTYRERQKLPPSAFAIPGEEKYPIPTVEQLREAGVPNPEKAAETHARNALARVAQHGTDSEKHRVCRLVATRHPEIHEGDCPIHGRGKFATAKEREIIRGHADQYFGPKLTLTKVASSDRGAEAFPKGKPKVRQLMPQGRVQVFRTFDDASSRNAEEQLRKARIPYTVTHSKQGSFRMVEFHTLPKYEGRAFRIIDEEVNSR